MRSKCRQTLRVEQRGFSLVELLVVISLVLIMTGISLFYFSAHQRLFKPDEQASKLIDILQEARQRSLTQRETMRVELDLTDNVARLINENLPNTSSDDVKIRETVLYAATDVKINARPPDISTDPPEPLTVPVSQFKPSIYPSSANHNVCTIRFLRNGTVANEGTNDVGAGATVTGFTVFIWSPKPGVANQSDIAKALTIIGTTGSIRLWDYVRNSSATNKWDDSRRSGAYGG